MLVSASNKDGRVAIRNIIEILLSKTFIVIYVIKSFYLYVSLLSIKVIFPYYSFNIKEFFIWFLVIGLGTFFGLIKLKEDDDFYNLTINTWRNTAILEFIINLHSFNLVIEILIIPLAIFLGLLQYISEIHPLKRMKTLLKKLVNFSLVSVSVISFIMILNNYNNYLNTNTLNSFITPALLTTLYTPYLYLVKVYITYQSFFQRISIKTNGKEQKKCLVKKLIFKTAKLNLNKLNRIQKHFDKRVFYEETNFKEYVNSISRIDHHKYLDS